MPYYCGDRDTFNVRWKTDGRVKDEQKWKKNVQASLIKTMLDLTTAQQKSAQLILKITNLCRIILLCA